MWDSPAMGDERERRRRARPPAPAPAAPTSRDRDAAALVVAAQRTAGNAAVQRSLAPRPAGAVLQRVVGVAQVGAKVRQKSTGIVWNLDAVLAPENNRARYRLTFSDAMRDIFADDDGYELVSDVSSSQQQQQQASSSSDVDVPQQKEQQKEEKEKEQDKQEARSTPRPNEMLVDAHLGILADDAPKNDLPVHRKAPQSAKGPYGLYKLRYGVGPWLVTVYWPAVWYDHGAGAPGPNLLGWLPTAEFANPNFFGDPVPRRSPGPIQPFTYRNWEGNLVTPAKAYVPTD